MSGCIRSQQRLIISLLALIVGPILVLTPALCGIWALTQVQLNVWSVLAGLLLIWSGGYIGSHMAENYQWVEFDGRQIRGRKLWSRRLVERSVTDVRDVRVLKGVVNDPTTLAVDAILGQARGWEIRFDRGPSVFLVRYDMTNAWEVALAVAIAVDELRAQSSAIDSDPMSATDS